MNSRSDGSSLVEVMLASVILVVGIVAVMNLFTVAVSRNNLNGDVATRVTEHCQDKIEQLMGLSFDDGSANTAVRPVAPTGGTGLGGIMPPNSVVGSFDPAARMLGFVDYLDEKGDPLTDPDSAFYVRQWSIATDSLGKLKTITVYATVVAYGSAAYGSRPPSTTLVSYKSAFF